jgi:hypothetical protein
MREIPVDTLSPAGTAENVPGRQSWVCRILPIEVSQDYILGHFQPSLRDWSSLSLLPRTHVLGYSQRPYGTEL